MYYPLRFPVCFVGKYAATFDFHYYFATKIIKENREKTENRILLACVTRVTRASKDSL